MFSIEGHLTQIAIDVNSPGTCRTFLESTHRPPVCDTPYTIFLRVVRLAFLHSVSPSAIAILDTPARYKCQPVIVSVSSRRRAQTTWDISIIGENKNPENMKLLALCVCLLVTVITTRASTIADTALHGAELSSAEIQECYQSAGLTEDELITSNEIKDGSYGQNTERAKKNGCFSACILQKRGLIVDKEIQKDKLYAKEAHAHLRPDVRAAIYAAVNRCVEEVKTNPDVCDKSLSLLVCLWRSFL